MIIKYSKAKDQLLIKERGISFDDVKKIIENDNAIAIIPNPSKNYSSQLGYVILLNDYIHFVPYVINEKRDEIFLKTIIPMRKLNKVYK